MCLIERSVSEEMQEEIIAVREYAVIGCRYEGGIKKE